MVVFVLQKCHLVVATRDNMTFSLHPGHHQPRSTSVAVSGEMCHWPLLEHLGCPRPAASGWLMATYNWEMYLYIYIYTYIQSISIIFTHIQYRPMIDIDKKFGDCQAIPGHPLLSKEHRQHLHSLQIQHSQGTSPEPALQSCLGYGKLVKGAGCAG